MIVALKSFQIGEKANLCGVAMVPNEQVELGKGPRQFDRLTFIADVGVILCEKEGKPDDLVSFAHCVKATSLDDIKPQLLSKAKK